MNTHNVNVKTAASESTETRVLKNFDVQLPVRTNRLVALAKLEGNLMTYRALDALEATGPDDGDDLLSDIRYAAELIAHPDVLIEVSKKLQARQEARRQAAYTQAAVGAHRLLMQLNDIPVSDNLQNIRKHCFKVFRINPE